MPEVVWVKQVAANDEYVQGYRFLISSGTNPTTQDNIPDFDGNLFSIAVEVKNTVDGDWWSLSHSGTSHTEIFICGSVYYKGSPQAINLRKHHEIGSNTSLKFYYQTNSGTGNPVYLDLKYLKE